MIWTSSYTPTSEAGQLPSALRVAIGSGLISAVFLVIGLYTFIPALVDQLVAGALRQQLGLSQTPTVRLQSDPAPAVLLGDFTGGRVVIEGGEFGGVEAERITIDLNPFELNLVQSLWSGRLMGEGEISGALRAELSEEEVAEVAREQVTQFPVGEVTLEGGRVTVGSDVEVFGLGVPITVEGEVELLESGELEFLPRRVEAFGVPVPEEITDRLLADSDFRFALEELPFEMELEEVGVEEGRLYVSGEVRDLLPG